MSILSLGDQELVKLYVNGNEKAFELLITRHKDRVYRFILSKIKDPELANDYFQDTFMKVILTLKGGNYNEEGISAVVDLFSMLHIGIYLIPHVSYYMHIYVL